MTENESFMNTIREVFKPNPPRVGRQSIDDALPKFDNYEPKMDEVNKMVSEFFNKRDIPENEQQEIIAEVRKLALEYVASM